MVGHVQLTYTREQWAKRLYAAAARPYSNEAELRYGLYTVLHPYCVEVVGLDEAQLRHEGTSSSGRFDTLLGTTLIEYKAPRELETNSRRRHHAEQALRYLADEHIGASVVLITDGYWWGILRDVPDAPFTEESLAEPAGPAEDRFQWRRNSEASAARVLDLLDTITFDPVNPRTLMNRLGPTTTQGRRLLRAMARSVEERASDGRTDILFRQWLALAGVSYGIDAEHSRWPAPHAKMLGVLDAALATAGYAVAIFTLHTYVALCSKLIAAESLALLRGTSERRPSQWAALRPEDFATELERLENGQFAVEMRAPRMMGGDLFGWYADAAREDPELRAAIRELVSAFAQLAWARLAHATRVSSDLLRDFYTGIVPRELRKGLGEFFTPEWIAERVVEKAVELSATSNSSQLRFLDPTCGSGTFLVAAMRRTINAARAEGMTPEEVARRAVDSVTGFDVNPVSPLMARVNLLLTLGDLVDHLPEVSLNVFQADSILVPEEPTGQIRLDQANAAVTVPLVIGDISLPPSLATLPAVSGLARITDDSIQRGRSVEVFSDRLRAEFPTMGVEAADTQSTIEIAIELYIKLYKLHVEGKDGVWAHVIEQSFAPRVLEPVDIVVGNPPWISWKNLPLEWRERSESTWRRWGLWQSKQKGGGTPMADISSLLLARAVDTYCPSGIVALLMPEGVLLNEPGGRAIRRCTLAVGTPAARSFAPVFVDDFSTLNPFADAANKPIALYVRSGAPPVFPIIATKWTRSKARASLPVDMGLQAARKVLETAEHVLGPVDPKDIASRWRPALPEGSVDAARPITVPGYTWGQGFHTRGADGIYFCEVISPAPYPGGLVQIRTSPQLGRNTRDLAPTEALVEARYLWPLVRGANVAPFRVESSGVYCLVPHDPDHPGQVLSRKDALRDAPRLYDFFEPYFDQLKGRSAYDMKIDDDHPWGIQGTAWRHMGRERVLVLCRYMEPSSRPPAAVYQPRHDPALGFNTTCYPNNKVNFLATSSLQEADFVAAFVNSRPAQDAIARRSSTTTIGPAMLNSLALPKFDRLNELHRKISAVGQECRLTPQAWPALGPELAQLVVELLEVS